jgi:hypothetical protein
LVGSRQSCAHSVASARIEPVALRKPSRICLDRPPTFPQFETNGPCQGERRQPDIDVRMPAIEANRRSPLRTPPEYHARFAGVNPRIERGAYATSWCETRLTPNSGLRGRPTSHHMCRLHDMRTRRVVLPRHGHAMSSAPLCHRAVWRHLMGAAFAEGAHASQARPLVWAV